MTFSETKKWHVNERIPPITFLERMKVVIGGEVINHQFFTMPWDRDHWRSVGGNIINGLPYVRPATCE